MPTAIGAYATLATLKARLFAAGVVDVADDGLLESICDQVNQFLEGPYGCKRVLAPIASAVYLLDGDGSNHIHFPLGIRAVSALAVGDFTGDTRDTVTSTDYVLRPAAHDRLTGMPAEYLWLSDRGTGVRRYFPAGRDTISLTCTAGFDAIPDDIIDVALTTAVRAWGARQSGQADIVGSDETGEPLVSRYVAIHHRGIIKGYRRKAPPVFGVRGPIVRTTPATLVLP